ncbi:hypothetical protein WJX75_003500 [Coccomyxa subellipsoidea]|uniref:PspA/IM30 n=1 Tax=Coccomyxa subellipsoidea TaxID=248742 RepID=A0ABR2Z0C1_9CHLO
MGTCSKPVLDAGQPFLTGNPLVATLAVKGSTRGRRASVCVQASLAGRLGRVVKSYFFFYGDSAMAELEDPRKLLDQAVTDMQADMAKMRTASAQVQVAQRQMEERYRSAQTAADDWKRRAEWALRKGDEDLAREALKRRKTFETTAQTMKQQLEAHMKASQTLRSNISMLESKVAEAISKKETLKARALSAQATKMLNEEISGLVGGLRSSSNSSVAAFARMEQKVEQLEAEAESAGQLGFFNDALESRFALMEGGSFVDDELLKLKMDMLAEGSSASLPSGRAEAPRAFESIPNFQTRSNNNVDIVWP